jgi:hypothetical protein
VNKNLVIGMVWNYKIKDVFIFVESWKKHCDSDLILVVNLNADKNLIKYLQKQNVIIYDFNCNTLNLPNTFRYYAFESILNELDYKKIFIADVRDIVFQDDIFLFSNNDLDFFMESINFSQTLNTNYYWYEYCYGIENVLKIMSKKVSCCGTVLGKQEEIKKYLEKMIEEFSDKNLNFFSLDTAAHNHILYNNILDIKKNDNGNGVATLQEVKKEKIKITNDNKILFDDKLPCVLHQYDRHNELKILFEQMYNYEKSISNP